MGQFLDPPPHRQSWLTDGETVSCYLSSASVERVSTVVMPEEKRDKRSADWQSALERQVRPLYLGTLDRWSLRGSTRTKPTTAQRSECTGRRFESGSNLCRWIQF